MATCKICGKKTLLSGVTFDGNPLVNGVCHDCLHPTANAPREKPQCHLCGDAIEDFGAVRTFYVTVGKAGIGISSVESVSVTAKGQSCRKCFKLVQVRQLAAVLFLVFGLFGLITLSLPLGWYFERVLGLKGGMLVLIALGAPVLVIVCCGILIATIDALILSTAACKAAILRLQSSLNQPSSGFISKTTSHFATFVVGNHKIIDLPNVRNQQIIDLPNVGERSDTKLQISDPAFEPLTSDQLKEWGS